MSKIEEATTVVKVRVDSMIQVEIMKNDQILDRHEVGTILPAMSLRKLNNISNRWWRPGKQWIIRAVYYSIIFTWGFYVKEMLVL